MGAGPWKLPASFLSRVLVLTFRQNSRLCICKEFAKPTGRYVSAAFGLSSNMDARRSVTKKDIAAAEGPKVNSRLS